MNTACPVCEGNTIVVREKYRSTHPVFMDMFRVHCDTCGMDYAYPMPAEKDIEHYNSEYFASAHGGKPEDPQLPDIGTQLLGSTSYLQREYRLQHELTYPAEYEIGVVNASPKNQKISCHIISTENNETLSVQKDNVPSRGSTVFKVVGHSNYLCRIIIKSHLVMARPLIFKIDHEKLDIFHG